MNPDVQTDAHEVARYILSLIDTNVGDTVSNLKLQKILYYCQGYFLALYNKPLFPNKVYAWMYGPVVRDVYDTYKTYGAQALEPLGSYEGNLSKEAKELIAKVYEQYGQFSAGKLVDMTHEESPWKDTPRDAEITTDAMKAFFSGKI